MRRLAWVAALTLTALAILWPSAALIARQDAGASGLGAPLYSPVPEHFLGSWTLLATSVTWAAGVALAATLLAWPIARALSRTIREVRAGRVGLRGQLVLACAALPLAFPSYIAFWTVWRFAAPGTWIGDVALASNGAVAMRQCALVLGMSLWIAPLVAWIVAASRLTRDNSDADLEALDRPRWRGRLRLAWAADGVSLRRGWAIGVVAALSEGVSFDLAQVRTYGFELRTLDAVGASPREVLALGWPAIVVTALLIVVALSGIRRDASASMPDRDRPRGRRSRVQTALLVAISCALPALFVAGFRDQGGLGTYWLLYGRATLLTLGLSLWVGAGVALLAAAFARLWEPARESRATRSRTLGIRAVALAWIVAAGLPPTLVAVAQAAAWNTRLGGPWIYDSGAAAVLGLIARFGVVAVAVGAIVAVSRGREAGELETVDAPTSARAAWRLWRRSCCVAAIAAAPVATALSFSDVGVASRLAPPELDLLTTSVLNAIHYQQPDTVMVATAIGLAISAAAAVAAIVLLSSPARRLRRAAFVLALGFLPVACTSHAPGEPEIPVDRAIGTSGFGPSQFHTPRAVAYDPRTDRFFVVDKEARVQRFRGDGTFELEWSMPDSKNGKPVGLSIHPDGRVFVADTHYYRVMVFDQEGHELARFGSYGKELGQFIYPTDVAFGKDGSIYVAEYGGNDRIQVFDSSFVPVRSFGRFGIGPDEMSRPQSIVFGEDGRELFVADSNNHRIHVYDPAGRLLRTLGHAGVGAGEFAYPRGVVPLGDGTLLVVEFGNHRVQQIDAETGAPLAMWGGPPLTGESTRESPVAAAMGLPRSELGRLKYPWDLAGVVGHVAVLDSGRDRLLLTRLP